MTTPELDHTTGLTLDRELLDRAREQANIRVDGFTYIDSGRDFWMLSQDWQEQGRFFDKVEAEYEADTLVLSLIESGAIGSAV